MINPMKLLQLKEGWEQFRARHPKFPGFLSSVSKNALTEGSVIEITVTTADGKMYQLQFKAHTRGYNADAALKRNDTGIKISDKKIRLPFFIKYAKITYVSLFLLRLCSEALQWLNKRRTLWNTLFPKRTRPS